MWRNEFDIIKKETLAQVFSCELYEIFKNIFFTEQRWMNALSNSDLLQRILTRIHNRIFHVSTF